VASLATPVDEARSLQISQQLANLACHDRKPAG
jgi:hypothetical protein